MEDLATLEKTILILFARMFCALLMHLSLLDNVQASLERIKFSLNHSYLFKYKFQAVLVPFIQFCMVFFVETMNMLVILTYFEPLNIVSNFVALSIVSEFDKMMYQSSGPQTLKKLLYEEVCDKVMVI